MDKCQNIKSSNSEDKNTVVGCQEARASSNNRQMVQKAAHLSWLTQIGFYGVAQ